MLWECFKNALKMLLVGRLDGAFGKKPCGCKEILGRKNYSDNAERVAKQRWNEL